MKKRRDLTDAERKALERFKRIWATQKQALNLTQESVALACGWSGQTAFTQYLNGYVPLNIEAVLRLAKVLKVSPTDIMPEVADLLPKQAILEEGNNYHVPVNNRQTILNSGQPRGLYDLACDEVLLHTLDITDEELGRLASVDLPSGVTKDGYVQLLFTLRTIVKGS